MNRFWNWFLAVKVTKYPNLIFISSLKINHLFSDHFLLNRFLNWFLSVKVTEYPNLIFIPSLKIHHLYTYILLNRFINWFLAVKVAKCPPTVHEIGHWPQLRNLFFFPLNIKARNKNEMVAECINKLLQWIVDSWRDTQMAFDDLSFAYA